MSIDALQEKIRKRKSALIVDMTIYPGQLPEHWAGDRKSVGRERVC